MLQNFVFCAADFMSVGTKKAAPALQNFSFFVVENRGLYMWPISLNHSYKRNNRILKFRKNQIPNCLC